ncbi:MAG: hypothetical protein M0P43_10790 [Arcobacteraceae bacterium]|nr:hypothetical protein [Arcobacteraceae bacterium]
MSGLIIFPIFILYVVVGFLVLNFLFSLFKWNIKKYIIVIVVILLPFWDLFIQKGIKTYYQASGLLEPILYEMPFKENELFKNLDISKIRSISKDNLLNKQIYDNYKISISDYIELESEDYFTNNSKKLTRLNLKEYSYEYINIPTSRYVIIPEYKKEMIFFQMAYITKMILFDRENNKIIAESSSIEFTDRYAKFRRHYLLLQVGLTQQDFFYINTESGNFKLFKILNLRI